MHKSLLPFSILGLVACGQASGDGTSNDPLSSGDESAMPTPSAEMPNGVGPAAAPGPVNQLSPATPISGDSPTGGASASAASSAGAPMSTGPATPISGAPATTDDEMEPDTGAPEGPGPDTSAPDGTAPASTSSEGEGGASSSSPASGGSATTPNETGGASSEEDPVTPVETPMFSRPEGTIPNSPQPESAVGVDRSNWQDGLISPTLQEGHQINQPAVVNGYMVIAGNEDFWIYDVSDPSAPDELSAFSTPNRRAGGEAESHTVSFARYGDTFLMVTVGGKGIDTWDVTDPRSPEHLGQLPISGVDYGDYTEAVWGVTWQGQYIYVGATNNGIKVVDATDPSALDIVAEVATSQYGGVSAGPLEAVGNVLVVMTPKESGGVATLDISDPTNPTRLASFSANKSYIGMFYRRWVFMIDPIRVWDVLSDPLNIGSGNAPIGTLPNEGSEYLSFGDDYLFLGHVREEINGNPGASKISVGDVGNMEVVERIWGRMDYGGKNDDQFTIPFGNLLVLGDDQAPYAGWVIAAHQVDPDTIAPEIDTVIPTDQESGVATTARIGITFSDNVELATVDAASFVVRPAGGEPLSGKYGVRMGVVNFDPDEDLEPGTTYEVVLPAGGITDLVGNTLATEWASTFTTE